MKHRSEIIEEWLSRLENPSKELTLWEKSVLISIQDQFDRSGRLSEHQEEILERIFAEQTD